MSRYILIAVLLVGWFVAVALLDLGDLGSILAALVAMLVGFGVIAAMHGGDPFHFWRKGTRS